MPNALRTALVGYLAAASATLGQTAGVDVPGDFVVSAEVGLLRGNIAQLGDVALLVRQIPTDLTPSDRPWEVFCLLRGGSTQPTLLQRRRQRDGSVVSEVAISTHVEALAYDRRSDRLIASWGLSLYEVDPETGVATSLGRSIRPVAMAFHEDLGLLFAVTGGGGASFWGWDEAGDRWTEIAPLATPTNALAFNPADGHLYCTSVAQGSQPTIETLFRIDPGTGQRTAVGSFAPEVVEDSSGLVFTTEPHCYADCDGDGALSVFDMLCFMNRFQDGDPLADCNQDGIFNVFDFICFQSHYAAGCG